MVTGDSRIALSALEVAPVWTGSSATRALRHAIALARRVEELGYLRFWIAEHHDVPSLATSATSVLIAAAAGATSTIRIGSGGVLLPNHPPLVVAEQFGTLEALYPGRIDLGIGRAVGGGERVARLLRRPAEADSEESFRAQITELAGYFAGPPYEPVSLGHAGAAAESRPPMVLLGSSPASARLAGSLGLPYAYAHHINPRDTVAAMAAYHESFRPSACRDRPYAIVAALVFAADTDEQARELATPLLVGQLEQRSGHPDALFPTAEQAANFRLTSGQREWARDRLDRQIWGSPQRVREQVAELCGATGAAELMALTMVCDQKRRVRSYELLAEAVRSLSPCATGCGAC